MPPTAGEPLEDLQALHTRLTRLCDAADIERLLFDHFAAVDEGRHEDQADFFARARVRYVQDDVVIMETNSRDEFLAAIRTARIYEDGTPRTHHIIGNIRVDVADDGASATSRCYSTVMQGSDDFPLQPIACGVFTDRFAKDENGWYFVDRVGRLRLAGAMDHHVAAAMADKIDMPTS